MEPLEILIALSTPDGKADPYPLYNALHEVSEVIEIGDNDVFVVGYDAINSVLRDPGFLVSSADTFDAALPEWRQNPVFVQASDWILNLNAPDHARIRSLITRAFTARRIGGLKPAIARMADGLLDDIADRGADGSTVEFMRDFAYLLPITVICELIGIPESDREAFRPVARDLVAVFEHTTDEDLPKINSAAVELLAYFSALATVKRANPSDDLLSDLLAIAESGDGRLTDAELLHNLTLLLVAGFETTANLLGNGLQVVLGDPPVGAAVADGSVPAQAFVEEVLRFDSPVQLTSRIGYDTKLHQAKITENSSVVTLLGAGNRDPRRFTEPGKFDPLRTDGGPLSFGGGAHFCIGAALARLEATVAFPRLFSRFPNLVAAGQPTRRDAMVLRGFDTLPITIA
ncbi:MAG TPA: cytochrome P450 [Streptosporangiaceae bacterium]|nr:cytochrome P450 [Streptosporangiaceae bacterium]